MDPTHARDTSPHASTRRQLLLWAALSSLPLMGWAAEPTPPIVTPPRSTPAALSIPAPLRLNYKINGKVGFFPYSAQGKLDWHHDSNDYTAKLEVEVLLIGTRTQVSRGRIVPTGLQPLRFVDRVSNDRTVEFDYSQGRVRFSEGAPPEPLPAGVQDHLSVFMQLGALIASAPQRYPAGTEINVPAFGIYGPETWRLVVAGEEKIDLPGGPQTAIKVSRPRTRDDDPSSDVWLAPALGWLPARIRLTQGNGDFVDQHG